MKKIVIAGAGFGGIKAFQLLSKYLRLGEEAELTLLNDTNYFLFTPLLHEVATGSLSPENIVVPLAPLAAGKGQRFIPAKVLKVLSAENKVLTDKGDIPYDYLILGLGSEVNYYNTPGTDKYVYSLKDLDDAARIKNKIISQFEKAACLKTASERRQALTFVIVGAGATGVELSGELADFCKFTFKKLYGPALVNNARIVVVQKEGHILPQFSDGLRHRSLATLGRKGVEVMINTGVKQVEEGKVILDTGEVILSDTIIWSAGVKPHQVDITPPLKLERDKVVVESSLMTSIPNIFALGDMVLFIDAKTKTPLPMLAQVADRQAKVVAKNVVRAVRGKPLKNFTYRSQGSLVSLGGWWAVGEVLGLHFAGRLAWVLWRGVYWSKMPTLSKKLQIGLDWILNAFRPRDVALLPFTKKNIHQ